MRKPSASMRVGVIPCLAPAARAVSHVAGTAPNGASMDHMPSINPLFIMLRTCVRSELKIARPTWEGGLCPRGMFARNAARPNTDRR